MGSCPIWFCVRLSDIGSAPVGKPPRPTVRRHEHDRQPRYGCPTDRAVARLPADSSVPTNEILRTLRSGGVKASVERALSVKHVFYAGDEAGIVCDVTPHA